MKNLIIFGILFFVISCKNENKQVSNLDSNIVTEFLNNIKSIESINYGNPIMIFQDKAEGLAVKTFDLSKENISDILTEIKDYKYCVIITGDHTIIKISDINNCKQSSSWGSCMPMSEGYIKKGKLLYKKDYVNNLIGLADSQKRKVYFFN